MTGADKTKGGTVPRLGLSLTAYFSVSFLLHLIWENAQAPLYAGFESFAQHFGACLYATATGDMIFMGVIYISLAGAFSEADWLRRPGLLRHPATWILPLMVGALLAASFELWAIHVEQRWVYGELMPVIPVLQIGLSPLVQMLVIPPLTLALVHGVLNRLARAASDG